MRLHGINQDKLIVGRQYYEKYRRGEPLEDKIKHYICPQREDIALIYRLLRQCGSYPFGYDMLWCRIRKINYCKMMICLDVMQELGLLEVQEGKTAAAPVLYCPKQTARTQLEKSGILKRLKVGE